MSEVQRWNMPSLGSLKVDDRDFVLALDYEKLEKKLGLIKQLLKNRHHLFDPKIHDEIAGVLADVDEDSDE